MSMDFSGSAGASSSMDTMPKGLLVFANLNVLGLKPSKTGGAYIECELTVDAGQPFAGRKIFSEKIADPSNMGNTEKWREMGTIAITRILECKGAGPNNLAGYKIDSYDQLSGRVAIKVGVEEGENGYPDKNKVAEWLTPNPASQSGNKGWVKLVAGDHGLTAAAPAAQAASGFGGFGGGAAAPAQTGGFGNAGGAAAATSGFQEPAGNASTTTTSPSEPGATPGWLGQAQGAAQ